MKPALLLLMIAAPLLVAAALLAGGGAPVVYAAYQLGVCLALPAAVDVGARGWSWSRHARHLGLTGPGTKRGLALGLALGLAAAGGILGFFALAGARVLDGADLADALRAWGLPPERLRAAALFMALVAGPAEELFWRGFCAAELADVRRRAVRLGVPSLLYASYHAVTLARLVGGIAWPLALFAAVAAAGWAWAWLRERTGSVWPALLSHGAAAGAYTLVAAGLVGG